MRTDKKKFRKEIYTFSFQLLQCTPDNLFPDKLPSDSIGDEFKLNTVAMSEGRFANLPKVIHLEFETLTAWLALAAALLGPDAIPKQQVQPKISLIIGYKDLASYYRENATMTA